MKRELIRKFGGLMLSGALHVAVGFAVLQAQDGGVLVTGQPNATSGEATILVSLVGRMTASADRPVTASATLAAPKTSSDKATAADDISTPAPDTAIQGKASAASDTQSGDAQVASLAAAPSSDALLYRQRLERHLSRYRTYPVAARAAGRQGVVTIHFSMTREGRVLDAWVETSSGTSEIDDEALAAVLRAQPLPPLPSSWPGRLDVSLPLAFRLG